MTFLRSFLAGETRPLVNSAGEVEADRASARFNIVEALMVFAVVQAGIWLFIGPSGANSAAGISVSAFAGYLLIGIAGIWGLVISPALHGDMLRSFGLPGPGEGSRSIRGMRGGARIAYWCGGILFCALLLLNLDFVTRKLGMRHTWFHTLLITDEVHIPKAPGYVFSLIAGLLLYAVITRFLIRWDNLWTSVKAMLLTAIPVWGGILLVGVLMARASGDWALFEQFRWLGWDPRRAFIPRTGFYLFWGMAQQWVFLGYFHTRIRRGVPPGRLGRAWVSLLTGIIFCVFHIPSWPLLPVAFAGGCFFGYFYQFDRYRNLFTMGLAHGVGGTMVAFLTHIRMSVGPWSMGG
jgi:hypothetical protein